ncbi:MAG: c-type cytochrome [Shinella sp.]|nr:c-type cytochrome [Shinella sp.]
MRLGRKHIAAIVFALPIAGMLVAWSGMIGIDARSGHWRATEWLLHWAMRSSVRTAAMSVTAPEKLNDEALPMVAGHFERGCAICHGSPAVERSPATLAMLPRPPDLSQVVGSWSDEELFVIIEDGVRYTGMPAWPAAGRSDEVWAMVAFMRRLPDMSAADYRRLSTAGAEESAAPAGVGYCQSCHAAERLSSGGQVPDLFGQSETYLLESLRAYARGDRPSGVMELAVSGMDETAMADAARFYARRVREGTVSTVTTSEPAERGRQLAERGDPIRKIPACDACHDGRNPRYPLIDGQPASYIRTQLELFKAGLRGGTAHSKLMTEASRSLEPQDIEALTRHYGR